MCNYMFLPFASQPIRYAVKQNHMTLLTVNVFKILMRSQWTATLRSDTFCTVAAQYSLTDNDFPEPTVSDSEYVLYLYGTLYINHRLCFII